MLQLISEQKEIEQPPTNIEMSRPTAAKRSLISFSLKNKFKGRPLISVSTQKLRFIPSHDCA